MFTSIKPHTCVAFSVSPCVSQTVKKKLETATNNTKTWKHKVAEHEGLLRLIQPGKQKPNEHPPAPCGAFLKSCLTVKIQV